MFKIRTLDEHTRIVECDGTLRVFTVDESRDYGGRITYHASFHLADDMDSLDAGSMPTSLSRWEADPVDAVLTGWEKFRKWFGDLIDEQGVTHPLPNVQQTAKNSVSVTQIIR